MFSAPFPLLALPLENFPDSNDDKENVTRSSIICPQSKLGHDDCIDDVDHAV